LDINIPAAGADGEGSTKVPPGAAAARDHGLTAIAAAQAGAGDLQAAAATIRETAGGKADDQPAEFYRPLAAAAARAGRLDAVKQWAKTFRGPAERGWVYLGAAEGLLDAAGESR
jgi:hypothetical protein